MEGKSGALKEYIAKLKEVKKTEWIMIILVLSIIISIYASTLNKSSNTNQDDTLPESQSGLHWIKNDDNIESREEQRLKEILSTIKGAGRVEVMITYVSSKEIVTAMNTVESTTTTEEEDNNGGTRLINQNDRNSQPSTFNDAEGSKPIILKEVEPEIRGVIIISEGANDIRVKMELMKAVQVALGIKPNQVEVFPMKEFD
ncbi:MAG: stage III sporulation protein AG [Clostridiales bacterium]|jgi:stage III sporulation protein AG|nr:stage III sporulation protein AG [Clostridiales bacterium]